MPKLRPLSQARREELWAYLFLAPWLIGLFGLIAGPMIASAVLSLTRYNLAQPPVFVGLENYVRALTADDLFWPSLGRTFLYTAIVVPLGVAGALLVAMALNQGLRFTTLYRTLYFLPHLTPAVASIFIWAWLFNPRFGLINEALWRAARIQGPTWLSSKEWALPALAIIALWGIVGGNMMLIFLAGLQAVPQDLYEAAAIDGAGALTRFRHVTLPMLSPTIFFNAILAIIGALQSFTVAYVATGGGPAYATWFFALHIYTNAFQYFQLGYASALAWILFFVLIVFTFIQFRASARWVYYAGEERG